MAITRKARLAQRRKRAKETMRTVRAANAVRTAEMIVAGRIPGEIVVRDAVNVFRNDCGLFAMCIRQSERNIKICSLMPGDPLAIQRSNECKASIPEWTAKLNELLRYVHIIENGARLAGMALPRWKNRNAVVRYAASNQSINPTPAMSDEEFLRQCGVAPWVN